MGVEAGGMLLPREDTKSERNFLKWRIDATMKWRTGLTGSRTAIEVTTGIGVSISIGTGEKTGLDGRTGPNAGRALAAAATVNIIMEAGRTSETGVTKDTAGVSRIEDTRIEGLTTGAMNAVSKETTAAAAIVNLIGDSKAIMETAALIAALKATTGIEVFKAADSKAVGLKAATKVGAARDEKPAALDSKIGIKEAALVVAASKVSGAASNLAIPITHRAVGAAA